MKAGRKNTTALHMGHALNMLPIALPVEWKAVNTECLLKNKHRLIAGHRVVLEVVAAITDTLDRKHGEITLGDIDTDLRICGKWLRRCSIVPQRP